MKKKFLLYMLAGMLALYPVTYAYASETDGNVEETTETEIDDATDNSIGSCGEDATYTLTDEGTLTISGTGSVRYSAFHKYYFSESDRIKDVIIEAGITAIENHVFYDCENLRSISLPEGMTSIGERAFSGCNRLESITLPDSITSIGLAAFMPCTSLTSVTLSSNLTSIAAMAFENCHSLSSIFIPDSVTSIGDSAFENCADDLVIMVCSDTSAGYSYAINNNITTQMHVLVTDAAVAATCTTAGKTEGSHCSVCKEIITAQKNIPAIGHKAGAWTTTKAATNLAAGKKVQKCTVCKKVINTASIPRISGVTLYKGINKSYTLTAGKWKLKKTKAATLKGNKLTIKKTGTIKVTEQKTKKTVTIKVKKPTISLNKTKVTLKVGASFQIKAQATPAAGISYKSAKSKIAKVSSKGLIKAVKKGKTTITVKANGVTKKITVRVKK